MVHKLPRRLDCLEKKNYFLIDCDECWCAWCEDRDRSESLGFTGPGNSMCAGERGCWSSKCGPCLDAKGTCYGFCQVCEESWCPDCDPIVTTEIKLKRKKKKTRGAYSIYRSPACKESLPRNPEVQLWLREQKNGDFWMWKYKRDKKK